MRNVKIIANNKQASHLYFLEDRYEAGIVLRGTEIKAVRSGKVSIQDSYVRVKNQEAFVINMHIAKYAHGTNFNHDETRERKLLLHKKEIIKISDKVARENYTLIPTKIYLKDGLCKLEFALAKGKKLFDKRQSLKEKDMQRRMDKELNRRG